MEHYVRFRSHKIDTSGLGTYAPTHRGRGSDFSDIAPYISGDDTRDISWKHSARATTLQKKIRLEDGNFPISIIDTISEDSWFCTEEKPKSPYQYTRELIQILEESSRKYHFPIRTIENPHQLQWVHNTMILYITTGLDIGELARIRALWEGNDVIVIHVFHPYEVHPTGSLIFWWLGLRNKQYIKRFNEIRVLFQKETYRTQSSYLFLMTDNTIVSRLNHFFKNRFSS